MRRGWVYALCEPDSCVIRYIGVSHNPEQRLRSHLKQARKLPPGSYPKTDWLRSLGDTEPTLLLLEEANYDDLPNIEKAWISRSRAAGAALTNQRNGGFEPQNRGRKRSEETRQKIREARAKQVFDNDARANMSRAQKRNWATRDAEFRAAVGERGRTSIDAARQVANEVWRGQHHSEETRALLRNQRVGKPLPETHLESVRKANSSPEMRLKRKEISTRRFSDPDERRKASERTKRVWSDPEYRKRQSELRRGRTQAPEVVAKRVASIRATRSRKQAEAQAEFDQLPNSIQRDVLQYLEDQQLQARQRKSVLQRERRQGFSK